MWVITYRSRFTQCVNSLAYSLCAKTQCANPELSVVSTRVHIWLHHLIHNMIKKCIQIWSHAFLPCHCIMQMYVMKCFTYFVKEWWNSRCRAQHAIFLLHLALATTCRKRSWLFLKWCLGSLYASWQVTPGYSLQQHHWRLHTQLLIGSMGAAFN